MINRGILLLVAVSVGLIASAIWAGPVGPEFLVNVYTDYGQENPSVAMNATGDCVVVWASEEQDGERYGVYGQRYDAFGNSVGSEFQVNSYSAGFQWYPEVAINASGNFVVTWTSEEQDGDENGIYAQRYDALGNAQGVEFQVNTYITARQQFSKVGMDNFGNFVIVWESEGQDGSSWEVYAQRYDTSGNNLGNEFRVNSTSENSQSDPSIAMDASGNFVVAWTSYGQDGDSYGVFAKRYDPSGVAQGDEFLVNTYTTGFQGVSSVSMDASGNFVIAWMDGEQDGDDRGIFAQRYVLGNPQGSEFQVNSYTIGKQDRPSVGMGASGDFVILWESGNDVYAQCYDPQGMPQGYEFRVNTFIDGLNWNSSVAMDGSGNFLVVWESWWHPPFEDRPDVYAQRYESSATVGSIVTTMPNTREGGTLGFKVTFSEPVTGVDVSDFTSFITGDISGATILSVTGSGSEYTVLVGNVAGNGTLRLDLIDDDSIIDSIGTPLGGLGIGNGDFTAGEAYHVVPELPVAVWPVLLILLVAGVAVLYKRKKAGAVA